MKKLKIKYLNNSNVFMAYLIESNNKLIMNPPPPLIFDDEYAKLDGISRNQYNEMFVKWYYSEKVQQYVHQSTQQLISLGEMNSILYMNFKSHNIFFKHQQMFALLQNSNANIVMLSEALVPTSISSHSGELIDLTQLQDDVIIQPYQACPNFTAKKNKNYASTGGTLQLENVWVSSMLGMGYRYAIFGNPTHCPYGTNWGNIVLMKNKPDFAAVYQLDAIKQHPESGWNCGESRCLVHIVIGDKNYFSTHLEDSIVEIRGQQLGQIMLIMDRLKIVNKLLVGDLNCINQYSYSESELQILTKFNRGDKLPVVDIIALITYFGINLINTGQKYECLFGKCVTHCIANFGARCLPLITNVTDGDHQPLMIYLN